MDNIKNIISNLKTWKKGDKVAPHKPLLLLYVMGCIESGAQNLFPFNTVESKLEEALLQFGSPAKNQNPHYPFWRLQNDKIWTVKADQEISLTKEGDPHISDLRNFHAVGSLKPDIYTRLKTDDVLRSKVVASILENYFPASQHAAICGFFGISDLIADMTALTRRTRNPRFREDVMLAYECRCAFCGINPLFNNSPLGLEAAHIKWHAYDGPDDVNNGLLLCVQHHHAFDRGAIGLDNDLRILVSQRLMGNDAVERVFHHISGHPLRKPQTNSSLPAMQFIQWHHSNVFKSPEREFAVKQAG